MARVNRKCLICNTEFTVPSYEVKRGWGLYCSKSCKTIHHNIKRKERNENIKRASR